MNYPNYTTERDIGYAVASLESWSSRLGVCREISPLTQENYFLKKLNVEMQDR